MHVIPILVILAGIVLWSAFDDPFDSAMAAAMDGQHETAISQYGEVLAKASASREMRARAHNNRGVAYDRKGMHLQALADFDAAMSLMPGDMTIITNRAIAARKAQHVRGQVTMRSWKAPEGTNLAALGTPRMMDRAGFLDRL